MKKMNHISECIFSGTKLCYNDDEVNSVCKYPTKIYDCSTGSTIETTTTKNGAISKEL